MKYLGEKNDVGNLTDRQPGLARFVGTPSSLLQLQSEHVSVRHGILTVFTCLPRVELGCRYGRDYIIIYYRGKACPCLLVLIIHFLSYNVAILHVLKANILFSICRI
jgi:hypothetical protein